MLNAYGEVAGVVGRYYEGVARANEATLNEVLDTIWNGKRINASRETLTVDGKHSLMVLSWQLSSAQTETKRLRRV